MSERNPIYMNVLSLLNNGTYDELWEHFRIRDTRARTLIKFMRKISASMPQNIDDHPLYVEMVKKRGGKDLTSPNERLSEQEFYEWIRTIEKILREEDMLVRYKESYDYKDAEVRILNVHDKLCDTEALKKILNVMFEPSKTHIIDGNKGGGKTHLAVFLMWLLCSALEFKDKSGKTIRYHAITNITFGSVVDGKLVRKMPENVHFSNSFSGIFGHVSDIINNQQDEEVRIVLFLDESQNFLKAKRAGTDMVVNMEKFFANTRKLNMSVALLTPSKTELPPQIRKFTNQYDSDEPGYNNYYWQKRPTRAAAYIKQKGLSIDKKQLVFFQNGDSMGGNDNESMFFVPSCPWNKSLQDLKEGEIAYDHMSIASLSYRDPFFDLDEFMESIAGLLSPEVPGAVKAYMDDVRERGMPTEETRKESVMDIKQSTYLSLCRIVRSNMAELGEDWSKHMAAIRSEYPDYPRIGDMTVSSNIGYVYKTYKHLLDDEDVQDGTKTEDLSDKTET